MAAIGLCFLPLLIQVILWLIHWRDSAKHTNIATRPTSTSALPVVRPFVRAVEYDKDQQKNTHGLVLRNSGYDALEISIPKVRIGSSGYMLSFEETLAELHERDHLRFIEGWLEDPSGTMPNRDGGALHEIMRKANVDAVEFSILYKSTEFQPYATRQVIERTNTQGNGLQVRTLGQELLCGASRS